MTAREAPASQTEPADETLAVPNAVSDLFQGNVPILEALAKLRLRLLDLTGRNRLLNFKHAPGKSLQFVDSNINGVFTQLVENAGSKVAVTPVPEPPRNKWVREGGRSARPDVKQYADEVGLSTSYELGAGAALEGGAVRALFYPDELARHCRKLAREARSAIEETGANMLFLVFGFLEYPERPDSEKVFLAPLVCVPVTLEKDRVDPTSGQDLYAVKYTGDDLTDNRSLREKLKGEYAFELPEFDEEAGPEAYIRQIKALVRAKPGWSVKRQMTLTLLSFSKMLLERELDPANWPTGADGQSMLLAHEIVRMVFEGAPNEDGSISPRGEDYDVDNHPASPLPLIYDADTSQLSALIDALAGKNLVIEGPPGTGKSQTITNLIATACPRRSNFDPPCRPNFDPGTGAGTMVAGCG